MLRHVATSAKGRVQGRHHNRRQQGNAVGAQIDGARIVDVCGRWWSDLEMRWIDCRFNTS